MQADRKGANPAQVRPVTIVDLARETGLSIASVSYALNGKPGVSEATRARVLKSAELAGWAPNQAARALQAKRSNAIGLVIRRDKPEQPMRSDFIYRFLDGINDQLVDRPESLLLRTVNSVEAEVETHRNWVTQGKVDALVIINLLAGEDPRLALVEELGVPTLTAGDIRGHKFVASVWTDDEEAMQLIVDHLISRGHRKMARMRAPGNLRHLALRDAVFARLLAEAGLPPALYVTATVDGCDSTRAQISDLLAGEDPPSVLQYDNTLQAAEALKALQQLGVAVPEQCSVISWEDTPFCETTQPSLTAIDRSAFAYGLAVGRQALNLIDTGSAEDTCGMTSHLIVRGST